MASGDGIAVSGGSAVIVGMVLLQPPGGSSDVDIAEDFASHILPLFGFISFRDSVQRDCTVASVRGRHLLCQLPTGYGKTLMALAPALALGGFTGIVVPTISLAHDMCRLCATQPAHVPVGLMKSQGMFKLARRSTGSKSLL